ncbi:MAG: DUF4247 domain-containing protein [Solirubrobacteraceae bacterium]|nr:DUF4247 domain-containing protein [Solirubrobacteraceae bacterium]
MSSRCKAWTLLLGGGFMALAALLAVVAAFGSVGGGVEGHVKAEYRASGTQNGARTFTSDKRVDEVVDDITDAWKPADRLADPGGVFLRYSDVIVAVRPRKPSGTDITVDDADRAYARWYPVVGGWFGTYSGRAEGFRGGGPGSGK